MGINRLTIDGYGQLELNNCAFRRDGRIEAQCALDATDFATIPAENGMILAIDRVTRTVHLPDSTKPWIVGLNYTAEHMYDERTPGLKNFKLEKGSFCPRLGYLAYGDKFTTNCISYNTSDFADDAALKAAVLTGAGAVAIYGSESSDGSILLKKTTAPQSTAVVLRAIEMTTMPDGQFAIKFQVM